MTLLYENVISVTGQMIPLVTFGFPSQRANDTIFYICFGVSLNKLLVKQSSGWWFDTQQWLSDVTVKTFLASQLITLGPTSLRHVDDDAFWGLNRLTEINIFQSQLTNPPSLHLACDALKTLKVVNANLQYIPNDYFQHCSTLFTIDFSKNYLRRFPNMSSIASTIQMVYVTHNEIKSLNFDDSVYFENLNVLDFSYNEIHAIDLTFNVTVVPRLVYLMLKYNRLSWFPHPNNWNWDVVVSRNINKSGHRLELDLEGNPWNCSNLSWLRGAALDGIQDGRTLSSAKHNISVLCFIYMWHVLP